MHVKRFDDPSVFLPYVQDFLMQREAEHNLMIGLLRRVAAHPDYYESYYFVGVEENGEIIAAAMRTLPHPLILSDTANPQAIVAIAEDAYDVFETIPGVQANKPHGEQFARYWQQLTGQPYRLNMAQRIYQLTAVRPVAAVPGQMRQAIRADVDLMREWMKAFLLEAEHNAVAADDQIEKTLERSFDNPERVVFFWEDNNVPVSMAAYTGRTPHGMRIGSVYTPPEQRRKGYASALVAGISQLLLNQGLQFCFLYTDLSNPTSNKIYQNIGYVPVCDAENWRFEPAD